MEPDVIDNINILEATLKSMHKNIDNLVIDIDHILVDGTNFRKYKKIPHTCIINGDSKYYSIAAASILAKVEHDWYIENLCKENKELDIKYDLLNNMGYGTKKHIEGIKKYGISKHHRKSNTIENKINNHNTKKKLYDYINSKIKSEPYVIYEIINHIIKIILTRK